MASHNRSSQINQILRLSHYDCQLITSSLTPDADATQVTVRAVAVAAMAGVAVAVEAD